MRRLSLYGDPLRDVPLIAANLHNDEHQGADYPATWTCCPHPACDGLARVLGDLEDAQVLREIDAAMRARDERVGR